MRRVIDRNFPKSEKWDEADPVAIAFKEYLRKNLRRGKALGEFRNWFIMNNQETILDESRTAPLDLGFKILSEAYKVTGRDNATVAIVKVARKSTAKSQSRIMRVIVKRAFEKYIDENINSALAYWRTVNATIEITQYSTMSFRLEQLADGNFLPDVKKTQNGEIIIRKGILLELYKHGVTKDQVPNLKALAGLHERGL